MYLARMKISLKRVYQRIRHLKNYQKAEYSQKNFSKAFLLVIKRAFDEFKTHWIPPVPLVYPQPAGILFAWVFADGKKNSGSDCIDASRLIFQSAVSFQIRLVAKKQAGPIRLYFCTPAVKPSEFTERTLSNLLQPKFGSGCIPS